MRRIHRLATTAALAGCIFVAVTGCSKAPDAELAAAKAAAQAARDVEADKYMPKNFQNVEKALAAAQEELAKQSKVFIMNRKYKRARILLTNVTQLATQITADAPGAKADLKTQVGEGLTSVQQMSKETRDYVKKAVRTKGKDAVKQMLADLDTADSALARASAEFAAGKIPDAWQNLGSAQELLRNIFSQFKTEGAEKDM